MARLRRRKIDRILHVTTSATELKKVLAAEKFYHYSRYKLLAKSNMLENIREAKLLQPIRTFNCFTSQCDHGV